MAFYSQFFKSGIRYFCFVAGSSQCETRKLNRRVAVLILNRSYLPEEEKGVSQLILYFLNFRRISDGIKNARFKF